MTSSLMRQTNPSVYKYTESGTVVNELNMNTGRFTKGLTRHEEYNLPNLFLEVQEMGISSIMIDTAYGTISISLINVEEEIRRVISVMDKKHLLYRYYTFIWILCTAALAVFSTSAISGLLGPLSSIAGIVLSITGIIGAYLDWKDKVRKDAY
ncbi:hypothetical protein BBD42_16885 [Paenibacillus sp. BIHB 4019]|uniref:Uncharacterized protein n=1 Tax=Paenibacillus sp. BIHB 4019 TaxID=1870819 RepID=A0A1B2DJU8_9BACL|nr:hypothetical protein [Paenibacillus sp. BIHB 4019]ANY67961.1 hypothetical protein BBD42_16885 [Paenibacillus sp. BIHB 4019]